MNSLFSDFRASLAPETAGKRIRYFSELRSHHERDLELRRARGEAVGFGTTAYLLAELLRAHEQFARGQYDELFPIPADETDAQRVDRLNRQSAYDACQR